MIGRKMALAQAASREYEEILITAPSLVEIRDAASKEFKRYGFVTLVMMIRAYVRSTNFLRRTGKNVSAKIKDKFAKKNASTEEPREVSKFLKMVAEYKQKVKRLKRRIHEEESQSEDNTPE